jgi:ribosome biogenesis protein Nip4
MLDDFIDQFSSKGIPWKRIGDSFFLDNPQLETFCLPSIKPTLFGCYLGTIKNNQFAPSFVLLDLISEFTDEKIMVNDRGEIDFLYGKHLRKRHILSIKGSQQKNTMKLVQNIHDENLGYGLFIGVSSKRAQVLRHILDRGVFIKRDKLQI